MREIKFRAFYKGEMYPVVTLFLGRVKQGVGIDRDGVWFELYLEEVELMQFTEMQDSHGRDIYDGDIVEIKQPYDTIAAEVCWGAVTSSYQWVCGQTWLFRFSNGAQGPVLPYLRYGYELRVIGNIYETPELLEKQS